MSNKLGTRNLLDLALHYKQWQSELRQIGIIFEFEEEQLADHLARYCLEGFEENPEWDSLRRMLMNMYALGNINGLTSSTKK
jgi:hypothetical protein